MKVEENVTTRYVDSNQLGNATIELPHPEPCDNDMGIGPITQILAVNTPHVRILYKYCKGPCQQLEDFDSMVHCKTIPEDQWDQKSFSHFVDINTAFLSKSTDTHVFSVTEKLADGLRLPPDGRENNHLAQVQSALSPLNAEN